MGRGKRGIPPWSYEDNPYSRFGIVCTDLLKSPQFQALSNPAKVLYLTMTAHARDEKAIECLHNAIMDLDALLGLKTPKVDIDRTVYQSDYKYFVFPLKQYALYGYDRKTVNKYKNELVEAGFIEEAVKQVRLKRVNIYEFSTNWKTKGWKFEKTEGDHVKTFWNG